MEFNLTVSLHTRFTPGFHDVILAADAALHDLGYRTAHHDGPDPDRVDLVFGHYLAPHRFPDRSVVYQLEPVCGYSQRNGRVQPDQLRRHVVWDYSRHNVEQLRGMGVQARYVPIGFHPVLERVRPAPEQDIDVLFYGLSSPRRELIVSALRRAGMNTVHSVGDYGVALDPILARAKVVLNMHSHSEFRVLESVRVAYLMSNSKAVVAEVNHADDDDELGEGIAGVPFPKLVDTCIDLVRDENARKELEDKAYATISRRHYTDVLSSVVHTAEPLDTFAGAWGPRG